MYRTHPLAVVRAVRTPAAVSITAAVLAAAVALAGCGGSAAGPPTVHVAPARSFALSGFQPAAPVNPGRPTTISFTVHQPSGQPLTQYRTGPGPHTGVHLIVVRDDLAYIIHQHPPVGLTGCCARP